MPNTVDPIPERQQSEAAKRHADKRYEAGEISGKRYEQVIARANKAGRKGRK